MQHQGVNYDVKFKVLIVGDSGVGKTSLLKTLIGKEFKSSMVSTVGIDFVKKGFEVDGANVLLEVWDTAGQERFRSITKFHYRGTKGIVLVYDVTNEDTLDTLDYWIKSIDQDIDKNNKEPVPVFIVGNKIDLEEQRTISKDQGQHVADCNFARGFVETSAKDNLNVNDVFSQLAYAMVEINDPALLNGYEHLKEKQSKNTPATVQITEQKDLKRKKKKKDHTRNGQSIILSQDKLKSKHNCACNKG